MTAERVELIRTRLEKSFTPTHLTIQDESHKHVGHASAGGAGHFDVDIVSTEFEEKSLIQRHRLVYDALDDIMHSEIHALSIKASTPAETAS
ncbi:Cell division protein BolA [hydrothermal vent metagenome]|uniref:Cell division protein BolA n=1 Tax=hydrothermal vent metagenome TaxID=652676 RepID=A0A3B0YR82_9ZZZZ